MGEPVQRARGRAPARHRSRIKRAAHAVIYGIVAAFVALGRWLPVELAVALGGAVGRLAALVAGRERRRALSNLERVWPAMPDGRRREVVRAAFENLGRSALECVVMHKLRRRLGAGAASPVRFVAGSAAALHEALAAGRGVVYVTGHVGNWELMAAAVATLAPVYVLARGSYDPRFTRLIDRFRRQSGIVSLWIEEPGCLRAALRALRQGAIVGVLVDQPAREGGVRLPFLGRSAPTTTIAAGLARASGAALVAGFIRRRRGCAHEVSVQRLAVAQRGGTRADRVALVEATRACSAAVERAVLDEPTQWTWSLDRWRFAAQGMR
jgi:KDO2-lipid IV(A) lauroyltransferase